MNLTRLEKKSNELRKTVLQMCLKAGTGHVSSSFSCIEIMVALYYGGILTVDPKDPKWEGRDRFVASKAQVSPLLYAILGDLGFFDKEWIWKFAEERFGVHLQNNIPGCEISAGSLGLGLGIATGMAYSLRRDKSDSLVYCLMGDAECYEGSVWEAALVASHNKLNNLVCIIDRNRMSATDFTEDLCELDPFIEKWRAFGWRSFGIDGHSLRQCLQAIKPSDKPVMIVADTVKGKCCKRMVGKPLYHSKVPECNECEEECNLIT